MNNAISNTQTNTFQTQLDIENMKKFDMMKPDVILEKIRLENEYNGEFRIMQNFSKKNRNVYYAQPYQQDFAKLIKSRTSIKETEVDNLMIQKLKENSKYIGPTHPTN